MGTKIEWCTDTWSPITGCTPIAEGCRNCYAKRIAKLRWKGRPFSDVRFHPERLTQPLKWRKPRRIFVCSMGDLFHEYVSFQTIGNIWDIFYDCPQHTFIILTKRIKQVQEYEKWIRQDIWRDNIWLLISCSTQEDVDYNIPILMQIPAAVRGVSLEPLIEPIDLSKYFYEEVQYEYFDYSLGIPDRDIKIEKSEAIDWLIVGCESGSNRRNCDINWIRSVKDQCVEAGVSVFIKQAENIYGKIQKMPKIDGRVWAQYPK